MKFFQLVLVLSSMLLIYESFIVPWLWIPVFLLLGILSYVCIDEYILLPRRREE